MEKLNLANIVETLKEEKQRLKNINFNEYQFEALITPKRGNIDLNIKLNNK